MDRRILLGLALASASLIAVSMPLHAAPSGNPASGKLKVVATITILGDMVQQVGGDHVALTTLVGPDGDAHAFEPTPVRRQGAERRRPRGGQRPRPRRLDGPADPGVGLPRADRGREPGRQAALHRRGRQDRDRPARLAGPRERPSLRGQHRGRAGQGRSGPRRRLSGHGQDLSGRDRRHGHLCPVRVRRRAARAPQGGQLPRRLRLLRRRLWRRVRRPPGHQRGCRALRPPT